MKRISTSFFLVLTLALGAALIAVRGAASPRAEEPAADAAPLPVAEGPFAPTMESLLAWRCPEWFRDAKFGIWAHWGPQAVPMAGDWYARQMYVQGHGQYQNHLENYGHPSTQGYKDIIPLWRAEKWDPDRLMSLYKRAGARYFVSMGVHHDNFDLWNSKFHRWNAVQMGPKRDVVGDWQKAAQKLGLRFGVSEHLGASFTWFQDSHRSDKTGPKAGVPYDGADPKYQDLYHAPAEPGDTNWYSNNPRWQRTWFRRIQDLVDQYRPDLLYTDGGVPFGNEVGRSLIAHMYNSDSARRAGKIEAVYTCKQRSEGRWIEDLERGVMSRINPDPWQTDTSIGDWYYNRNWKFRPVSWVIHMLVDIVSKNGNLLLNVVQRPDGSLDPEVETMLEQMAAWTAVNGEAIFETRPWLVCGEGPVRTKGGALYAIALGRPADGKLVIRSLARPEGNPVNSIERVSLLGFAGAVEWKQTLEGLEIALPTLAKGEITCSFKITGKDLAPVAVPVPETIVEPDAKGSLALLPDTARFEGEQIAAEAQGGEPNIGFWDRGDESVVWKVRFPKAGAYRVSVSAATVHDGVGFQVLVGDRKLEGKAPRTGSWAEFQVLDLGRVEVGKAGAEAVKLLPLDAKTWKAVNFRWIKFVPAN
jgi:alpha-L-fucosidase